MTLSEPRLSTLSLTTDQIRSFQEEGYLVIDQISDEAEIGQIREIYDRLFAEQTGRERGNQFDLAGADEEGKVARLPQILGPSNYAPELRNTLAWANAGVIMEQLLNGVPTARGDHAILKPAHFGAPTPWHQDEAYWDPAADHHSLSVWMPLQDVDEKSGCMHFVPRSHHGKVVAHRQIGNDPRVHGLEVDGEIDASTAIGVPLMAGGCTIHAQRTLHYAPGNTSDIPRRAYIMMGGLAATPREIPYDYYWQERWDTARQKRAKTFGS